MKDNKGDNNCIEYSTIVIHRNSTNNLKQKAHTAIFLCLCNIVWYEMSEWIRDEKNKDIYLLWDNWMWNMFHSI